MSHKRSSHNTYWKDEDAAALVPYNRRAEEKPEGTFRTGRAKMVQAVRLQERDVCSGSSYRAPQTQLNDRAPQTQLSYRALQTQLDYRAPQTQLSYRTPEPQPPYRGPHGQLPYLKIARFYSPHPSSRASQGPPSWFQEAPVSRDDRYQSTRESGRGSYEHTRQVARPQTGKSMVIRPGELHHFGCHTDYARGEIIRTLCCCNDPDSYDDAYTMLDSSRGKDRFGKPIDWQEARRRVLDFQKKDRTSHAEKIEAIPLNSINWLWWVEAIGHVTARRASTFFDSITN